MVRLPQLIPLLFALLLAGCGYHLRGALELPEAMQVTRLSGIDTREPLALEIVTALQGSGVQMAAGGDAAAAVLEIHLHRESRRITAVDSLGRASEYELGFRLEFSLRDAEGETMIERQHVQLSRNYPYDSANILGKSGEEELLRRELRRDAVRLMLLRLRAQAVNPPPPDNSNVEEVGQ